MALVKFNTRTSPRNFDYFFNDFFSDPAGQVEVNSKSAAPANVFETTQAYHLELNVPGRSKEDFQVRIEKNLLTISYEKKESTDEKEVKNVRREFGFDSFTRSFSLDEKIDIENIEAKYENGLLKFTLPKVEEKKQPVKTIAIQ